MNEIILGGLYAVVAVWSARIALIFEAGEGNGARYIHRLILWPKVITWTFICTHVIYSGDCEMYMVIPAVIALLACTMTEDAMRRKM
jgi:hypothetical protein